MFLSGLGASAAAPQIVLFLVKELGTPLPIAGLYYLTNLTAPIAGYLVGNHSDRTWDWPKKINQLQIQDLFRLRFIDEKANAIFLGLCGLGKTHLSTALGYAACQHGYSVLFANAIDAINTLSVALAQGALKTQLKRYLSPALLILDEVGYLPIDQRGADLLFQVISQRYERGSIVITSNKAFKQWPSIFNGDTLLPLPSSIDFFIMPKPS